MSFLQAHWDVLASVDFTTIEVRTQSGLVTCCLLWVMELATRRVHFGAVPANNSIQEVNIKLTESG